MRNLLTALTLAVALPSMAQTAAPARPRGAALRGDLVVALRQVPEQAGYVVGTAPRTPALAPQQVMVRNGETAVLRMAQSLPVKWTQSVMQGGASEGAGVSYGLVWMEAGQGFTGHAALARRAAAGHAADRGDQRQRGRQHRRRAAQPAAQPAVDHGQCTAGRTGDGGVNRW